MVRLTILGDSDLRREDGTVVASVLAQPRRFALLVYLALESSGGSVQRDRLIGAFWPETPESKGRQALRTALHFLRRSLSKDAIVGRGGALSLDPDLVSCDAGEFRARLRDGDAEAALREYRGDLLPGFYLDGAPVEFERWLEAQRLSLRREAADAAWGLADEQEAAGNSAGAGAWARKAAELSEGDEAAVRRAIELLGRNGDRAGARELYDTLDLRLRTEYEMAPSPETTEAVARACADDTDTGEAELEAAPSVDAEPRRSASPGKRAGGSRRSIGRRLGSAAATILLLAAFYSLWGLRHAAAPPAARAAEVAPTLLVEPIRDFSGTVTSTADGGEAVRPTDGMAGALGLELTARLGELDGLVVLTDTSAQKPQYVLRGGILRSGTTTRVNAILLDGTSGAALHRFTLDDSLGASGAGFEGLAEALTLRVRRELGRAVEERTWRSATSENRPLELVRRAVEDVATADSLQSAGAVAAAAVALAAADSQLALAQTAAPRWSEPSVQRGEVALERMWLHIVPPAIDRPAARRSLRQGVAQATSALRIAPGDPAAHEIRGVLRYWLVANRATDSAAADSTLARAEADLLEATRLDAGRARAWSFLSVIRNRRGDFAGAHLAARRAYAADAFLQSTPDILVRLFSTSLEIGDEAAAERWCEEISRRLSGSWLPAYCHLQRLAWGAGSEATPKELQALIDEATTDGPGRQVRRQLEMTAAVALANAGLETEARQWMERASRAGNTETNLLELEAWARLALGERAAARELLRQAVASAPHRQPAILESRRFVTLGL